MNITTSVPLLIEEELVLLVIDWLDDVIISVVVSIIALVDVTVIVLTEVVVLALAVPYSPNPTAVVMIRTATTAPKTAFVIALLSLKKLLMEHVSKGKRYLAGFRYLYEFCYNSITDC